MVTAIILTYNEEIHLDRCLSSLQGICSDIIIVDSFSNDKTQIIADSYGCRFVQHEFKTHSDQLNWALENEIIKTEWVLRIDADEYLSQDLRSSLIELKWESINSEYCGISVNRLMFFMGKGLKKGGMYPIRHLRLWRAGTAFCEKRLMDEHMILRKGSILHVKGDLIDHNLNDITWWINKHNSYATREAIDIVINELLESNVKEKQFRTSESAQSRRAFKTMYLFLPLFWRVFILFFFRLIFQGAILEGVRGVIWTTFQGLWYRLLVDFKVKEFYRIDGIEINTFRKHILDKYRLDIKHYIQ